MMFVLFFWGEPFFLLVVLAFVHAVHIFRHLQRVLPAGGVTHLPVLNMLPHLVVVQDDTDLGTTRCENSRVKVFSFRGYFSRAYLRQYVYTIIHTCSIRAVYTLSTTILTYIHKYRLENKPVFSSSWYLRAASYIYLILNLFWDYGASRVSVLRFLSPNSF